MENKAESKGNGGKVAIIGAIITAIAGIITTIVSISGPIIDRKLAIQATQTHEAFVIEVTRVAGASTQKGDSATAAVVAAEQVTATATIQAANQATATPAPKLPGLRASPTFTKAAVSAKPQPSATPASQMLKVGETHDFGNGITVTLTQIEFPAANEVHLHFTFANTSKKVMNLKLYHNRNVTLSDDKGNIYQWASDFTWEITIYPGTERKDEVKKRGNVSQASYFIVKLDMPDIGSAQWKQ